MNIIDIGSRNPYPSSDLSNFAAHRFILDGVECESMEGLLQSFKYEDQQLQLRCCKKIGFAAKKFGREAPDWRPNCILWWLGQPVKRLEPEYQHLLNRAYMSLYSNVKFREALHLTTGSILIHSMGRTDPRQTILTEKEFCDRLMKLREGRYL